MENMEVWNKLKQPDPKHLKKIAFGPLKGMSDIKPQWRLQAMTEVFGICGIGWKYTIDKTWTQEGTASLFNASDKTLGTGKTLMVFVEVSVYVKHNGEWSEAIPGIGGSSMLEKNKYGLTDNDEAVKMALTDSLGVAFKALGVAADVYLGNFDGTKYKNDPPPIQQPPTPHPLTAWSQSFAQCLKDCETDDHMSDLLKVEKDKLCECPQAWIRKFKEMAVTAYPDFKWPADLTGK